jgi:hypothetical protein
MGLKLMANDRNWHGFKEHMIACFYDYTHSMALRMNYGYNNGLGVGKGVDGRGWLW